MASEVQRHEVGAVDIRPPIERRHEPSDLERDAFKEQGHSWVHESRSQFCILRAMKKSVQIDVRYKYSAMLLVLCGRVDPVQNVVGPSDLEVDTE